MRPLQMLGDSREDLQVLCLGAHSDDIEIGCGGTILRLCQERPGIVVHWVVLAAPGERAEEARKGADIFRASAAAGEVRIHGFRDGFFPFQGTEIKELFESLKEELNPDLIFTHFRDDRHQDHRLVSDLTWNTWRDHTILEYEVPKWDGDLGGPSGYVPLSAGLARAKVDGILATFRSQGKKDWFHPETFMALMRLRGNECRAEEAFAEAFYLRKVRLL